MPFEYPKLKKNKPNINWVWDQNFYLMELKDAIQQRWYAYISLPGDPVRSQQKILDELNAIANFRTTAENLLEAAKSREEVLRQELSKRKLKCI